MIGQMLKEINGKWLPVVEDLQDEEMPKTEDTRSYSQKVEDLVREKYTVSDELAILRQRNKKRAEFNEYYEYVESCKEKAKL